MEERYCQEDPGRIGSQLLIDSGAYLRTGGYVNGSLGSKGEVPVLGTLLFEAVLGK